MTWRRLPRVRAEQVGATRSGRPRVGIELKRIAVDCSTSAGSSDRAASPMARRQTGRLSRMAHDEPVDPPAFCAARRPGVWLSTGKSRRILARSSRGSLGSFRTARRVARRNSGEDGVAGLASISRVECRGRVPAPFCGTGHASPDVIDRIVKGQGLRRRRKSSSSTSKRPGETACRFPLPGSRWSSRVGLAGHGLPADQTTGALPAAAAASPLRLCCRRAAAPSRPPSPIDSTAVLGTIIKAPFSFRPS
jgi:hypothetical protein